MNFQNFIIISLFLHFQLIPFYHFFILCIFLGAHPDISSLLDLLLEACESGVGGCDHTGSTLFDIKEKVFNSCLSFLRPMISTAMTKMKGR